MMLRTCFPVALAALAGVSFAQESRFNAGDVVEAHSYFYNPPWHKATVVRVGGNCGAATPFRVHFIGPDAGDHGDPCVGPNDIRALGGEGRKSEASRFAGHNPGRGMADGTFKTGDRVDVYAADNRDKGPRGTIMENAGSGFKIHYDGCDASKDVVVSRADLHPAATIDPRAAEIAFLFGAWKLFTPSYPNTVVRGNTIFREYGFGATAPPLMIKADGTYVWFDEYNKPPVKGTWRADSKVEGAKYWAAFASGVVIKDSAGGEWKAYRWKLQGDTEDRIVVHTLCSGQTMTGTRISSSR